jgi:hypothetical protein
MSELVYLWLKSTFSAADRQKSACPATVRRPDLDLYASLIVQGVVWTRCFWTQAACMSLDRGHFGLTDWRFDVQYETSIRTVSPFSIPSVSSLPQDQKSSIDDSQSALMFTQMTNSIGEQSTVRILCQSTDQCCTLYLEALSQLMYNLYDDDVGTFSSRLSIFPLGSHRLRVLPFRLYCRCLGRELLENGNEPASKSALAHHWPTNHNRLLSRRC